MRNLFAVQVAQAIDDIMEESHSDIFTDALVPNNVIEKFTTVQKLHYEEDLARCVYDLEQLDDIRVAAAAKCRGKSDRMVLFRENGEVQARI
jgi:hypothetical protein